MASLVGPNGHAVGLDISQLLLDCAESRKASGDHKNIQFQLTDAQSHIFTPVSFDRLISRFGVMFFSDPVAAFKNMAVALRRGGRMSFTCWAPAADNPWFTVPRDAAIEQLGKPPPADSTDPVPFAFSDTDRVLGIFVQAGLVPCTAETEDINLFYSGTIDQAASLACSIGPAVRIVKAFEGTAEDIGAIERKTAEGFEKFAADGGVRVPAVVNFFSAVKS